MKRKASFSLRSPRSSSSFYENHVSPIPCSLDDAMASDDTPQHLHSRTRKRFRNDRPDEQTVYDNTLRWLFSAQKHAEADDLPDASVANVGSIDSTDSTAVESNMADDFTLSIKPDPSQRTLHHFFRPASAPARVSSDTCTPLSTPTHPASQESVSRSSSSVMSTDVSRASMGDTVDVDVDVEMDMDMDMDIDVGADGEMGMGMSVGSFTASATALTPAFQQQTWMDGKDLAPVRRFYLMS